MPIINGDRSTKKDTIKVSINADISKQITDYCQWANVNDISIFVEESARFVFSKDKEWKNHQRSLAKLKKKST